MARAKSSSSGVSASTATIGFEAKLWLTADKLRNKMNAGEYKHVVPGLIARPSTIPTGFAKTTTCAGTEQQRRRSKRRLTR